MCNSDQTGAKEEIDHRMKGHSNAIESKEITFNLNEAIRICIICRHNPSALRYYAVYRKWYLDQIIQIASFLTGFGFYWRTIVTPANTQRPIGCINSKHQVRRFSAIQMPGRLKLQIYKLANFKMEVKHEQYCHTDASRRPVYEVPVSKYTSNSCNCQLLSRMLSIKSNCT